MDKLSGWEINEGDKIYYSQQLSMGRFNVLEIKVRAVYKEDHWFSGVEKRTKQAYLFNDSDMGVILFRTHDEALKDCLEKEKNWIEKN